MPLGIKDKFALALMIEATRNASSKILERSNNAARKAGLPTVLNGEDTWKTYAEDWEIEIVEAVQLLPRIQTATAAATMQLVGEIATAT